MRMQLMRRSISGILIEILTEMHLILVSIILREATAYGDSRQSREPEVSTTALLFAIG